jgi:hypothetical protein
MERLFKLLDVSTSTGQFCALLVLYCITITLRTFGHHWVEQDHTLIMGAILVLLKTQAHSSSSTANVAEAGSVQINKVETDDVKEETDGTASKAHA